MTARARDDGGCKPFRLALGAGFGKRPADTVGVEIAAIDRGARLLPPGLVEPARMGLLLISHDLQQVSRFADRVIVMRRGQIEEELAAGDLSQARSNYTRSLWAARPSAATYGQRLPVFEDDA